MNAKPEKTLNPLNPSKCQQTLFYLRERITASCTPIRWFDYSKNPPQEKTYIAPHQDVGCPKVLRQYQQMLDACYPEEKRDYENRNKEFEASFKS